MPTPWLPASRVVSTTVATKPHNSQLLQFIASMLTLRLCPVTQCQRGIDDTQVRKGLWKISQRFARVRLDFFREEINVVGETERSLEHFARFRHFSAPRQKIHFPETANGKRAFMPIPALLIAINETA